ncbi:FAD-dependent oxidoreductase [Kitasatospora sp. NPDC048296]|uniref:FAD-dependent oxidoreductase n=1 Tax=Kitasatospora sp. NPDC048296 TaxID=3364048 RepID=UPI003719FFAF
MTRPEAQLLIVGAGPAGCLAAVTAASVGMTSLLIDPAPIPGGSLWQIGHLANWPGFSDGPSYARVLGAHLAGLDGHCSYVQAQVTTIEATEDLVRATLADGSSVAGEALIVATGVHTAKSTEVSWITCTEAFPPITGASPVDLGACTVVLGGDRPLGTWLRTHPNADRKLTVCYPERDGYKVEEVRSDERVQLLPVRAVSVTGTGPYTVDILRADGGQDTVEADSVLTNIGTVPTALPGLAVGEDGFCPPAAQHPRVVTAGDLTARDGQRVSTAAGDGADAALTLYSRFRRQAV